MRPSILMGREGRNTQRQVVGQNGIPNIQAVTPLIIQCGPEAFSPWPQSHYSNPIFHRWQDRFPLHKDRDISSLSSPPSSLVRAILVGRMPVREPPGHLPSHCARWAMRVKHFLYDLSGGGVIRKVRGTGVQGNPLTSSCPLNPPGAQ